MRRRLRYFRLFGLMTIVFAIVLGLYFRMRKPPKPPETVEDVQTQVTKQIVVAARDLMPRTLLTTDLLEEREVPSVPEGAFTSKDELVGRLALTLIRKGEPIFSQNVTPPLKELSAAYLIPTGQIGMALTISRPETVPPLRVGDYISIHAAFAGMKVRTIVKRAMVLAINNRVGEISLETSSQPTQQQQTSQQQQRTQTPIPEAERLVLFVALSPQEAKAVVLAIDSGATLYYTLHSAPLQPFPFPELERDLTLQELVGSQEVASLIARKQHGELPNLPVQPQRESKPLQPVTLAPFTLQLNRIDASVQDLRRRVERLEVRPANQNSKAVDSEASERHIIGILGDQKVAFTVPIRR